MSRTKVYDKGTNSWVYADNTFGKDGISPVISVSTITGGHKITITDKDGTKTATINDGIDGQTPIKGTHYWTEEDKAEIKAYIDEAILGGKW